MLTLGLAVLVLAVMTMLVAPPLRGVAVRAPAPTAPVPGECGDVRGGVLVIVQCTEVHTVEVTYSSSAAQPAAGPVPSFSVCAAKAREYVGRPPAQDADAHGVGRWTAPLRYRPLIARGPDGSSTVPDWSWQLCLVAPMGPAPFQGYVGRVRAVPATGPDPGELRTCYSDPGRARVVVPCTSPHSGEVIATQPVPAITAADEPPWSGSTRSCVEAAKAAAGTSDPTYGGQLRVVVLSDTTGPRHMPFTADVGVYYTSDGLSWLVCALETVDDRRLVDSVAGTGPGALPFS